MTDLRRSVRLGGVLEDEPPGAPDVYDAPLPQHVFAQVVDQPEQLNGDCSTVPARTKRKLHAEIAEPQHSEDDEETNNNFEQSYDDTDEQTSEYPDYEPVVFRCMTQARPPRSWCLAVVTNPWFERLSMILILVNCITLGMYRPCEDHPVCSTARCITLEIFDHVLFCFFTVEMAIKIIAMGLYGRKSYLDSPWNRLDAAVVFAGLLEYCVGPDRDINLTALRAVRVLRPLRAINRIPSLRILVTLLLDTLPMLGNVLLLCFFVFFIFGIIGVQLWQSVLRNRCKMNDTVIETARSEYGISMPQFFQASYPDREFICSRSTDDGMQRCTEVPAFVETKPRRRCNLTIEQCKNFPLNCSSYWNRTATSNETYSSLFSNETGCINWNHYYDNCTIGDKNPFLGAISFDNIGFAWVAIFQVISLEAWVDILYAIQDAFSYWSFIYFVALIVIGSFFMINLCLVVIATQFSDTKKRETERIRQERMRALSTSTLTVFSESHGLYREMVKLTVHLLRKVRRNTKRFYREVKHSRMLASIWPELVKRHCATQHNRTSLCVVSNDQMRHERPGSSRRDERSSSSVSFYSPHCACCTHCCMRTSRRLHAAQGTQAYASCRSQGQLGKSNIEIRITSEQNSDLQNDEENLQIRLVLPVEDVQDSRIHFSDVAEYNLVSSTDLSPTAPRADSEFSDVDPLNSPRTRCTSEHNRVQAQTHNQTPAQAHVQAPQSNSNTSSALQSPTCSASIYVASDCTSPRPSSQCSCRRSCFSSSTDDACFHAAHASCHFHSHANCDERRRSHVYSACHNHQHHHHHHHHRYAGQPCVRPHRQSSAYRKSHAARRTWKRFRAKLKEIITHRYMQRGILVCILLNTLSMGIEHHNQPQTLTDILEYSNLLFTTLFTVEMLLKLMAYGILGYVSNIFNVWDSIIVVLSIIELAQGGASGLSVLRTFRLLRILKLVRFMPALRRQLVVMLRTMDNVTTFLVLLALFMFIFSILGMNLFGCQFCETDRLGNRKCDRKNFDSLLWASITVFQVLTQEDWNAVLYLGMSKTTAWASLYFVALMTFGNYVLFNLLVAILVEGFATDDRLSIASKPSAERTPKSSSAKNSPSGNSRGHSTVKSPARCSEARASVMSGTSRCSRYSNYSELTSQNGHVPSKCNHHHHHHHSNCHHHHCDQHELRVRHANCVQVQSSRNSGEEQLVPPIITTTHATPTQSPRRAIATIVVTDSTETNQTNDQQSVASFLDLLRSQSQHPTLPYDPDSVSFQSIDRSNLTLDEVANNDLHAPIVNHCNGHLPGGERKKKKLPRFDSTILRHGSLRECELDTKDAAKQIDSNLLHPQMCLHASFRVKRSPSPARRFPLLSVPPSVDCPLTHRGASDSITSCPQDLLMDRTYHSSTDSSLHSVFANPQLCAADTARDADDYDERTNTDDCNSSLEDDTSDDELNDDDLERKVYKEVERAIQEQDQIENDPAAVGEIAFDMHKYMPEARGCFKTRQEYSLYVFAPENKLRQCCVKIVESRWFEVVVLIFIVLNCVALACERPFHNEQLWERDVLNVANYLFTIVFSVEMLIKVIANNFVIGERAYMSSGWNRMDGILVLISLIDFIVSLSSISSSHRIFQILRVFRLLRTLRPLRVINRAPGLKLVVQTLLSSLRPIGNIVLICCAFFIIFGILGVQLFKGKFYYCDGVNLVNITNVTDCERAGLRWVNHQYNFDNLGQALMTLFVLASKDGWVQIMYQGLDAVGENLQPIENYNEWRLIYFISFLLIVGFFVISMFVGVIVDNFNRARYLQMTEEKTRRLRNRIAKLRKRLEQGRQLPYWHCYPSWRLAMYKLITNKYFDLAIAAIIGLNVITMALEFYLMPDALKMILEILNYFFTIMFIIEGALKIVALGFVRYIRDRWNQLDLVIIVLSIVGIVLEDVGYDVFRVNPTLIRVFRVLRIARVLKLLKMAKGIRELLDTVVQALPQVGNLGLLFFLLFFIFAALGVELFGSLECSEDRPCVGMDKHANFQNFANAFLTLFRIATGDNWNGIMKDTLRHDCNTEPDCEKNCCVSTIAAPLFFVVFVLIAQFVLVNVVIAVLMRHLEDAHRSIDDEDLVNDLSLAANLRAELQAILNDLHGMNINMRRRKSCIFPALPRIVAPPLESHFDGSKNNDEHCDEKKRLHHSVERSVD